MGLLGKLGKWMVYRDTQQHAQQMRKVKASVTQALLYQGQEVRWPDRDYGKFAKEAYMLNVVAYRCVVAIAQAAAAVTPILMQRKRGKDSKIEEHEVLDLLAYPNPDECGNLLFYKYLSFILMAGNTYMERVKLLTGKNALPKELYVLRPDRMKILINENGIKKGYEYQVGNNKRIFDIDLITGQSDIMHMKLFHPLDDWYGMSPVEPASRDIDTDNEAVTWNMRLLQNQARPGMLFLFKKQGLTDEQYQALDKRLTEDFSGGDNRGKHLILEGEDVDAKPYGWNPEEMDFIEGGNVKMRRIALGFGAPPMLLGIPGDNTYSNYKEARLDFTETTVATYVGWLYKALNNWLFERKSGMYLAPDWDSVSALEPRRKEKWDKAAIATWLTENEKRTMTGYDAVGPEADVLLASSTQVPLEDVVNGTVGGEEIDDDDEDDDTDDDNEE